MKKLLALFGLALASAQAQDATEDALEEEVDIKRYTVEVLIFTYEEDVHTGTEIFRPDPAPDVEEPLLDEDGNPIIADDTVPVFTDSEPAVDDSEEVEEPEPHWIIVPDTSMNVVDPDTEVNPFQLVLTAEDDYLLADALRKFELLDAYETLMHVGWTQPAFAEEDTPPIELALFGELPEGLDGSLTLYLSRYLHLVVDLALDAPTENIEKPIEPDPFFTFGDSRFGYEEPPAPQPVRWRIQDDRIFRTGELRYFDHPKFGVLAKVVRVEEEEPDDAQQDELVGRFAQ